MRLLLVALCLLLSIGSTGRAHAEKRVALVVGNSGYEHAGRLANPLNDAADMVAALAKHGFQVIEGYDLDKIAFDRKVRDFAAALKGAEAGVFFFAGHGLQVAGQNYLVPTDARAEGAETLDLEMVRVDVVHRIMERQTNTNILFLDACRDNPLVRNLARTMGTRSAEVGRGLAIVESGIGTLISFSTQPGNVALDGTGRNSPFAGALVKQLSSATDDLSAMLIAVRNDVMKETQRKQVPWEHSALTGRFYFTRSGPSPSTASASPALDTAVVASPSQTHAVAREVFSDRDLQRVAALAKKRSLLFPNFTMEAASAEVPSEIRRFQGIWGSDAGYDGGLGRQAMLIVTGVNASSQAEGYFLYGPPTSASFNQSPAGFQRFSGAIAGSKLSWNSGPNFKREAVLQSNGDIVQQDRFFDGRVATITLKRLWTALESERSAKR